MSDVVFVLGKSGTGKSTSLRTLDPRETFIINVLDKALPFKGFKKSYNIFNNENRNGNYFTSDDYEKIIYTIKYVNEKRPEIKSIVLDDFQYTMANEFMRKAADKGYEKFTSIGMHAWSIVRTLSGCRADLQCFLLSHSEVDHDGHVKCKTVGKMIDEKIVLEAMATVILHTSVEQGKYRFLTQNDGTHVAKSPMDMFKDTYIPNDLAFVKQAMTAYANEDITAC